MNVLPFHAAHTARYPGRVCNDIIGSHADFRREDYITARTQSRYSGKLVRSRAPFGTNWALVGSVAVGVVLLFILLLVV
jgi:hypothetical protein